MPNINQKGGLQILLAILLVSGIAVGVYLVRQKTNLLPQASISEPISSQSPVPSIPATYLVKPYLVYPSDKPMYPEYETAVKAYMQELQSWYLSKVGKTFYMAQLKVVRSAYTYDTIRCDPNPNDTIPPNASCLSDPKRLDGNLGMYMNKAIHNGVEAWDPQTAALIFSAGGGGYAGANKYPNDTGFAITGDWVLEPISGVANSWGIPCSLSDGWQCSGGVPKGSPAHELGHAFGLPHPGSQYNGQSIMEWHGDYPTIGFIQKEIDSLKNSSFFKIQASPSPSPSASPTSSPVPPPVLCNPKKFDPNTWEIISLGVCKAGKQTNRYQCQNKLRNYKVSCPRPTNIPKV